VETEGKNISPYQPTLVEMEDSRFSLCPQTSDLIGVQNPKIEHKFILLMINNR